MSEKSEERTVVRIPEAMRIVKVSRRTIYNWIDEGKVEYIRTASGSIRIFYDTLFRDGAGRSFPSGTNPLSQGRS